MNITLTKGAASLLYHTLTSPGWCRDPGQFVLIGALLDKLPSFPTVGILQNLPPGDREEALATWAKTSADPVDITATEYDAVRDCLTFFAARGTISPNRNAAVLYAKFGFASGG